MQKCVRGTLWHENLLLLSCWNVQQVEQTISILYNILYLGHKKDDQAYFKKPKIHCQNARDEENLWHRAERTCPCMFMMTTVLDRLQTANCSTLRSRGWMLCTVMSVPARPPSDLNVFKHSVLLMFHTFIVPSELALAFVTIECVS